MPTGYTAGILDGEIKTFQQFAKLCTRNFGATIHMRDEPFSKEYEPRTPSDYYIKNIDKTKSSLLELSKMSDADLMADEKAELEKSQKYHKKSIEEAKVKRATLIKFLKEAKQWKPPTPQHEEFKKFLEDQITSTIEFDCGSQYHDEKIDEIVKQFIKMDPDVIRLARTEKLNKDLAYYEKEHKAEVARCAASNQWVEQIFETF